MWQKNRNYDNGDKKPEEMRKLINKTRAYMKEHHMVREGDVIVTGVSGGADSVCLLFVLCALRDEMGFRVAVCHVNHGLRGAEADADEQYVKGLCARMDIPCHVFHENVELIARKRKQSLEEAGRFVRREAFEEVCRREGGTRIAAAHHRDDNAETVLLHIARGTGLKGLCGIRPVSGKWIRPFLCVSREEIEHALSREGIPWCTDVTNSEDEYTRNRIRHHILPAMKDQVNAAASVHLCELASQSMEIWDYMEKQVRIAEERCLSAKGTERIYIRKDALESEHPAVQKMILHHAICMAAGEERDISLIHVEDIQRLFGRQSGKRCSLPYGLEARRVYEGVELARQQTEAPYHEEFRLNVPGDTFLEGEFWPERSENGENESKKRWKITCRIIEVPFNKEFTNTMKMLPQKSYTKCFDYDIIQCNLSVRTRRTGDYITLNSDGGRQKLKSYFINRKIPADKRGSLLLIADGNHVVWIPGMRMSSMYQIGDRTERVLEIKIMEEQTDVRDDQNINQ